jgi:fructose-1-phosphate kinase PfkB-like protein
MRTRGGTTNFDNLVLAGGDPVETTLPKAALLARNAADVPVGTGADTVPETLVAAAKAMWLASGLPAAAAAARLAQLTVLLHEIGHVVGFDHDAASMQEVLEGNRAPLVVFAAV